MYRKIVWCYIFVLSLLEVPFNYKLTVQGKSHGVLHDTLIEGITFQEWGDGNSGALSNGAATGPATPGASIQLDPPALHFGRCALAAAHARRVSLTNTGNATLHLASVSGTTPDFHASFFDAKTLPPQGNTSFSVVYLGRREGEVSAHLYIHTSHGVHKYEVSAWGEASEYRVWPLVAVRVPANVTYSPTLHIHNPTEQTLQVSEVYSSARWVGLTLPSAGGRAEATRELWTLPPHSTRPLVSLSLSHSEEAAHHTRQAYIRIKLEGVSTPLVVCVELAAAAGSVFAAPHLLYHHVRGTRDPPTQVEVALGNSGARTEDVLGSATLRCGEGGEGAGGHSAVHVQLQRETLPPHAPLAPALTLTLHWDRLDATFPASCAGAGCWRWCRGELSVSGHSVPIRARLTPGTLVMRPPQISVVTSSQEQAMAPQTLVVVNEFSIPVHLTHLDAPSEIDDHFHRSAFEPRVLTPGATAAVLTLSLRSHVPDAALSSHLTLRTNISDYNVPVLLYSGKFIFEWEWPVPGARTSDGSLDAGLLTASSTRRVRGVLRNPGPARLCLTALATDLEGAAVQFLPCVSIDLDNADCWCVEGGATGGVSLTLVAPARAGPAAGSVRAVTAQATTTARVRLRAGAGRLQPRPVLLVDCAPHAHCRAPLLLDSTHARAMTVLAVTSPTAALSHVPAAGPAVLAPGLSRAGYLQLAPELLCDPHCYTGLDTTAPEWRDWEVRGLSGSGEGLVGEVRELRARRELFQNATRRLQYTALLHTTEVVMCEVAVVATLQWPRLSTGAGAAGLAGVGARVPLRVRVANPSASHVLLLQPLLGPEPDLWSELAGGEASCGEDCEVAPTAFVLDSWSVEAGDVRHRSGPSSAPVLWLAPRASLLLHFSFTPHLPKHIVSPLYLRNNLTILEVVQLSGAGAVPRFKFGNRRAGSGAPLLFDLTEHHLRDCAPPANAAPPNLTVKRAFTARNTGPIAVHVRALLLEGSTCEGYGFKVLNCEPFHLEPNGTYKVEIAFTPDFTLSRVQRTLTLVTADGVPANYSLLATVPGALLAECGRALPRPAWERHLRHAAVSLCLCLGLAVLAAAALDSDRILKRALAAMARDHRTAPLDLRALHRTPPERLWPDDSPRQKYEEPPPPPPPPPPRHKKKLTKRHVDHGDRDSKEKPDGADWKKSTDCDSSASKHEEQTNSIQVAEAPVYDNLIKFDTVRTLKTPEPCVTRDTKTSSPARQVKEPAPREKHENIRTRGVGVECDRSEERGRSAECRGNLERGRSEERRDSSEGGRSEARGGSLERGRSELRGDSSERCRSEERAGSSERGGSEGGHGDDEDSASTGTDSSHIDDQDKDTRLVNRETNVSKPLEKKAGSAHEHTRVQSARARREASSPRHDPDVQRQRAPPKHRKDKPARKRADRPPAPRPEPEARSSPPGNALRWGTTFSEVVARSSDALYSAVVAPRRPAPPPPHPPPPPHEGGGVFGCGVRPREPDNNNLFYFNRASEVGVIGQPLPQVPPSAPELWEPHATYSDSSSMLAPGYSRLGSGLWGSGNGMGGVTSMGGTGIGSTGIGGSGMGGTGMGGIGMGGIGGPGMGGTGMGGTGMGGIGGPGMGGTGMGGAGMGGTSMGGTNMGGTGMGMTGIGSTGIGGSGMGGPGLGVTGIGSTGMGVTGIGGTGIGSNGMGGTGIGGTSIGGGAAPVGGEHAAQWLWGGYGLQPPQQQMSQVREFDPFQSLSSIWSPGAADWRPREHSPQ